MMRNFEALSNSPLVLSCLCTNNLPKIKWVFPAQLPEIIPTSPDNDRKVASFPMRSPVSNDKQQLKSAADATLIARIAQKDSQAFAEFFADYAIRVKAFLMRYGTEASDADDLAQEVMVQVWRRAETFDPNKASASTWVFTIARNRRIDRLRKIARAQPIEDDPLFQPDPEPDAVEVLSANAREIRIKEALAGLNKEQRQVIEASFFMGMSHGEVADALEIPLGTVKSRIRLAFKALRQALGEDAIDDVRDD